MEEQINEIANSKAFKNDKIRIMPDGHAGKGCVVGTTIKYSDKIVPNIVGVDIACRVSLAELNIKRDNITDDFCGTSMRLFITMFLLEEMFTTF